MRTRCFLWYGLFIALLSACTSRPGENAEPLNRLATIYPDYSGLAIPENLAPLNFLIQEEGEAYYARLSWPDGSYSLAAKDGDFRFPEKKWKEMLAAASGKEIRYELFVQRDGKWYRFNTFTNAVTHDKVDPWLYYRLLHPGYIKWKEIKIARRSLESFDEKMLVENTVLDDNCVNCHAFNQQNPDNFMIHVRGSLGGTYFVTDGDLKRFNLKTKEMENGATYPRWHPSGKFVAFSSNKVVQRFHSMEMKKIEVSDLNSSLVLYDVEKNEMMAVPVDREHAFMDTYPEWSPDGRFLYFCRARQIGEEYDYRDIKYNLCRVSFDSDSRSFGKPEVLIDAEAEGKSVSFPRISPDGSSLVFVKHNYGCFSIWHKEADLYSIRLDDFTVEACGVNSEFTESYHSWSSNGRWMIFSSKRGDGLTARPYIAYFDEGGQWHKPFILPQKDPRFYDTFLETYNIPEFARAKVAFSPGELRRASGKDAVQARWAKQ